MKPENIYLVDTGGRKALAKVLDFGISKIKHSKSIQTQDHSLLGTAYYMSPEQAKGSVHEIDQTTDIFALGTICYHALTGSLPFDGPNLPGVLYAVCHERQKSVDDRVAGLPHGIDAVLSRALAKNKQERYQRVMQFVDDLVQVLLDTGPRSEAEKPRPRLRTGGRDGAATPSPPVEIDVFGATAATGPQLQISTDPGADALGRTGAAGDLDVWATTSGGRKNTTMSRATGETCAAGDAPLDAVHGARANRRRTLMAGLGVCVLIAAVVLVYVQLRPPRPVTETLAGTAVMENSTSDDPATPVASRTISPDTSSHRSSPDAEISARVMIKLELHPISARVLLDGSPRTDNPLVLNADGTKHLLEVHADGYISARGDLLANQNRTVRVRLKLKRTSPAGKRVPRVTAPPKPPGRATLPIPPVQKTKPTAAPPPTKKTAPPPAKKTAPPPTKKTAPPPAKKPLGESTMDF